MSVEQVLIARELWTPPMTHLTLAHVRPSQVHGDRYTYAYKSGGGKDESRDVFLNERDPLWPKLRHMHIADAMTRVVEDFKEFMKGNATAALAKGDASDLKVGEGEGLSLQASPPQEREWTRD